jgi:hypothetical protein
MIWASHYEGKLCLECLAHQSFAPQIGFSLVKTTLNVRSFGTFEQSQYHGSGPYDSFKLSLYHGPPAFASFVLVVPPLVLAID